MKNEELIERYNDIREKTQLLVEENDNRNNLFKNNTMLAVLYIESEKDLLHKMVKESTCDSSGHTIVYYHLRSTIGDFDEYAVNLAIRKYLGYYSSDFKFNLSMGTIFTMISIFVAWDLFF